MGLEELLPKGLGRTLGGLLSDPEALLLILLILVLAREEKHRGLVLALAFVLLSGDSGGKEERPSVIPPPD